MVLLKLYLENTKLEDLRITLSILLVSSGQEMREIETITQYVCTLEQY